MKITFTKLVREDLKEMGISSHNVLESFNNFYNKPDKVITNKPNLIKTNIFKIVYYYSKDFFGNIIIQITGINYLYEGGSLNE